MLSRVLLILLWLAAHSSQWLDFSRRSVNIKMGFIFPRPRPEIPVSSVRGPYLSWMMKYFRGSVEMPLGVA